MPVAEVAGSNEPSKDREDTTNGVPNLVSTAQTNHTRPDDNRWNPHDPPILLHRVFGSRIFGTTTDV